MGAITPRQIRKIKVLARRLGLDDGEYREMLWGVARVKSCKELTGPMIDAVIRHLQRCTGAPSPQPSPSGERGLTGAPAGKPTSSPGLATARQLAAIRGMWDRVSLAPPAGREQALRKFLFKHFRVAAVEWLDLSTASKVIEGLKKMVRRAA
jgi:hypothetical protein